MTLFIIEETDYETQQPLYWVGVDENTARELWKANMVRLYFVREDAEGLIQNEEDLEEAIEFGAVGIEGSYLWHEKFKDEMQQTYRQNDKRTFLQWAENKIKNKYL